MSGIQNQHERHSDSRNYVSAKIRKHLGLEAQLKNPQWGDDCDLLLENGVKIAVRSSVLRRYRHTVCSRGKSYTYKYEGWHFILHTRGVQNLGRANFVACVARGSVGPRTHDVYIIPRKKILAKTFLLHRGKAPYLGRYARYKNAWRNLDRGRRSIHRLVAAG